MVTKYSGCSVAAVALGLFFAAGCSSQKLAYNDVKDRIPLLANGKSRVWLYSDGQASFRVTVSPGGEVTLPRRMGYPCAFVDAPPGACTVTTEWSTEGLFNLNRTGPSTSLPLVANHTYYVWMGYVGKESWEIGGLVNRVNSNSWVLQERREDNGRANLELCNYVGVLDAASPSGK